ncbi:Nop53 (60S ribosomal biogenesis) [Ceratobasidium sp. AG-Ba]|nr:Nop53 (60S ribosomal biogenesis) [Ceratobasidium sp. AG-Ba]
MLGTQAQYRPLSKAALARKRAMAISTVNRVNKLKSSKSRYGAPAQKAQATRKGKKAWRKNVDIEDVEDTLEDLREEERITGGPVHAKSNAELFEIDVHGDNQLKKKLQGHKPLKSTQILSERSAVPAVFSVPTPTASNSSRPRIRVSAAERAHLARIAHRTANPLDAVQGRSRLPTSEAVRRSGKYDIWSSENLSPDEAWVREVRTSEAKEILLPIVRSHRERAPPRGPPSVPPLTSAPLPSAVKVPEQGTSYNPTYEAHQDLLRAAHEREAKRVEEYERAEAIRRRMEAAREAGEQGIEGMLLDVDINEDEEEVEDEALEPVRMPGRKTAQQRRRAARALAEKRARANLAQKRQQLASLTTLKSIHRAVTSAQSEAERAAALRAQKKVARGLIGMRIGKHVVKEGDIDVQLGEDLAESLRELKPEGNLWRDRWGSLVVRGKVEPRVPVVGRRKKKTKEYEKHSYKQFDANN